MINLLSVALGGALGASARYLIAQLIQHSNFPYATMAVNLLGSLMIGILMAWFSAQTQLSTKTQLFLVTGFLGGFTTFSSFSFQNLQLIEKGMFGAFAVYFIVSNIGGITLAWLGYKITLNQLNI